MNKNEKYLQRRNELKSLSKIAQMAIKSGASDASHVNEWILDHYMENEPEISEFNTFHQWNEKGFQIKKGSQAYVVWGSPRKVEQEKPDPEDPANDEYKYWPLCYLFSDQQVTERKPS